MDFKNYRRYRNKLNSLITNRLVDPTTVMKNMELNESKITSIKSTQEDEDIINKLSNDTFEELRNENLTLLVYYIIFRII